MRFGQGRLGNGSLITFPPFRDPEAKKVQTGLSDEPQGPSSSDELASTHEAPHPMGSTTPKESHVLQPSLHTGAREGHDTFTPHLPSFLNYAYLTQS